MEFEKMSVVELKNFLKERNASASGKKADLVSRAKQIPKAVPEKPRLIKGAKNGQKSHQLKLKHKGKNLK